MLLIGTNLQFDNPNHSIIQTQVCQRKCLDYRALTVVDIKTIQLRFFIYFLSAHIQVDVKM